MNILQRIKDFFIVNVEERVKAAADATQKAEKAAANKGSAASDGNTAATASPNAPAQSQAQPQEASAGAANPGNGAAPNQGNVYDFHGNGQPAAHPQAPVHAEYIIVLHSSSECIRVIGYIKMNASVFLSLEYIEDSAERQSCVDILSGAAFALGCTMNKISQKGIYLISSPRVRVFDLTGNMFNQKDNRRPQRQFYDFREASGSGETGSTRYSSAKNENANAAGQAASVPEKPASYYRGGSPTERFASPVYQNAGTIFGNRRNPYSGGNTGSWPNVQ